MRGRVRATALMTVSMVGPALAVRWLDRLDGAGRLRVDWSDPWGWLGRAPFEDAAAALLRLAAIGLSGWLTVTTLLYLLARLSGAGSLAGAAARLTLPVLRRAADRLTAGSLVLTTLTAPLLPAAAWQSTAVTVADGYLPPGLVLPVPAASRPDQPASSGYLPVGSSAPAPLGSEAVVRPGDHLWGLAERRLWEATGRAASDDLVAPYWRAVVAANLPRLRSGDPDLIFPGEVVVLPPVITPPDGG